MRTLRTPRTQRDAAGLSGLPTVSTPTADCFAAGDHTDSGRIGRVNPSSAMASVLVDELAANGVTDVVLAPGSRNAPLSMALFDADRAGKLRLHVRVDERSAGFLAVGLAKASGRPVPVVTTSGTAAANLHPAVVEADLAGVPLLVITADRPPWMRDVGANQVIAQPGLFGRSVRFFHEFETPTRIAGQNARWRSMVCRTVAAATQHPSGPVHLNVCLAEPLLPDGDLDWPESLAGAAGPWTRVDMAHVRTGTVAAPRAGERCLFIAELGHPLAEPLSAAGQLVVSESGGAAGPAVLDAGFHLLADAALLDAHRPDRIVVLGRPTLHRPVTDLLTDSRNHVEMVAGGTGWRGLAGNVRLVAPNLAYGADGGHGADSRAAEHGPDGANDAELPEAQWAETWRRANREAAKAIGEVLDGAPLSWSPALCRALVAEMEVGTPLVLGSSQPARDLSLGAAARSAVPVFANRGAAGIDGTVSTAVGVALGAGRPAVGYLGDLTLLHDQNGLLLGPHEPRPDLTLVVSDNDGGGIFAVLEPGDEPHRDAFERVFATPSGADLEAVAAAAGVPFTAPTNRSELAAAVAAPHGLSLVAVRTDRVGLRRQLAELRAAVGDALRRL